jgi:hypothetical protein
MAGGGGDTAKLIMRKLAVPLFSNRVQHLKVENGRYTKIISYLQLLL